MPRPKKNPNYNSADITRQLIVAVTEAYLNPTSDVADENGRTPLKLLAEEFSMTPIKIRKLLVTAGVYETPISNKIQSLYQEGKSIKEIQEITGLSAASVNGYLPYKKTVYKMSETTLLAERLRKYRNRKNAVSNLAVAMTNGEALQIKDALWTAIVAFEGYPFQTAKGLKYSYTVKGNEIFFSRKEKSVTKASVHMALETAIGLNKIGIVITGPKMLKCFGASYLYPVFKRIGVICDRVKVI